MGTFTKPLDLYKSQKAMFERNVMTLKQGHAALGEAGLKDAQDLTAGTLSPEQTRGAFAREPSSDGTGKRRMLSGKQLSRRGMKGQAPLLPANEQSHDLHNSFRLRKVSASADQSFELTEEDAGGGIFRIIKGGTEKIVDSGFWDEIKRRWKARNKAFLDYFRSVQRRD